MAVLAIDGRRHTNAELILDCAELGYLRPIDAILDATWGYGTFWQHWAPAGPLVSNDFASHKADYHFDWTEPLPERWGEAFDVVVFDPPYKLNGTPTQDVGGMDERYGVHDADTWQQRLATCRSGIRNLSACVRPGGIMLIKCQAQVVAGAVRWQDMDFANVAQAWCGPLVDRLDLLSYRPQPEGRRQLHARRNHSTLLVHRKAK